MSLREIRRDGSGAEKEATNSPKKPPKETSKGSAKEIVGYTAMVYMTNNEAQEFFKRLKTALG